MRQKIEKILSEKNIDFFSLPLSARILLTTDGTVTDLLEAILMEPLGVNFQQQTSVSKPSGISPVIFREITLQGKVSAQNWLYAESELYTDNITGDALALLESKQPIGHVLHEFYPENKRAIQQCGFVRHTKASKHFNVESDYLFLYRAYNIYCHECFLMRIAEWFPIDKIETCIFSKINF